MLVGDVGSSSIDGCCIEIRLLLPFAASMKDQWLLDLSQWLLLLLWFKLGDRKK